MKGISVKSLVLAGALVACVSGAARGNTITPVYNPATSTPGVFVYDAGVTASRLIAGDGFTIFDVGGFLGADASSVTYVGVPVVAPTDWIATFSTFGSPIGDGTPNPLLPNASDSGLPNVHFVYDGATVDIEIGTYLGFRILTASDDTDFDVFLSQDHIFGTNNLGVENSNPIVVPQNIPDQGSTMTLLGLAMLSVGLLRRHLIY